MLSTIETLRAKIRALVNDIIKTDIETFTYTNSSIFTLAESNIETISTVFKNGSELTTGEYTFDSSTNKIEITIALINSDIIEVDYTYYKYSTTELDEWIKASLVWLTVFDTSEKNYELEDGDIFPTPDNRTLNLIVLIASVLIKPDWTEYRLPNLTVRYNKRMSKEDRIEKLINRFTLGLGVNKVLEFN